MERSSRGEGDNEEWENQRISMRIDLEVLNSFDLIMTTSITETGRKSENEHANITATEKDRGTENEGESEDEHEILSSIQ